MHVTSLSLVCSIQISNQDNSIIWELFHFDILSIGEWEIDAFASTTVCSESLLLIPNFITISCDTSSTGNKIRIKDNLLQRQKDNWLSDPKKSLFLPGFQNLNFIPTTKFPCKHHLNMKLLLHETDVILFYSGRY